MTEWDETKLGIEPHLAFHHLSQCCIDYWMGLKAKRSTLLRGGTWRLYCKTCNTEIATDPNQTWSISGVELRRRRRAAKAAEEAEAEDALQEPA